MKIEFDWRIIEGEEDEPEPVQPPPPRPTRRVPRWLIVLVTIPLLAIAIFAGYVAWVYHAQLSRATREVSVVAKSEERAVAANDQASFMALQDPDDPAWRTLQEGRFGRLERVGLPEFGLKATGAMPQPGSVTLEPGGAQLDMTYQFSVTLPMPSGPISITLRVPQFYKQTPSGWVHALPGADFWGPQRSLAGKRVLALYSQRDADVIESLVYHMDKVLERVCASLPCPSQVTVTFETSPDSVGGRQGYASYRLGGSTFKFLSPHLTGLPDDERSRDELYRAFETQVVRGLVTASSFPRQRPYWNSAAYQQITRWYLAQAGLTGPFITPAITSTLVTEMQGGTWQPLSAISLQSRSTGTGDAMVPLAFAFLAERLGANSIAQLTPAMATSSTVGEAIRMTLHINPTTLEADWQAYLRAQAGLVPLAKLDLPKGELALECRTDPAVLSFSILRVHADGTGLTPITEQNQSAFQPAWSPDGKRLAFAQGDQVVVMDASDRHVLKTIPGSSRSMFRFGWLPDGELWVDRSGDGGMYRVNVDTGQDVEIKGARPIQSPDGTRMAYLEYTPDPIIWMADTDGQHARPVVLGYGLDSHSSGQASDPPAAIEVMDMASDTVVPLSKDLNEINWVSGPAWSPDGSWIAMTVWRSGSPTFLVLDSHTGEVRTQKRGMALSSRAWSADGRHVAFQPEPDSSFRAAVGILDVLSDHLVSLLGNSWDWSLDGKWLAVTQKPSGVLLITPDGEVTRRLDTPECTNVAWRPFS
jgi:hypothetical protein